MNICINKFIQMFEDENPEDISELCKILKDGNLKLNPSIISHISMSLYELTFLCQERFSYEEYFRIVKCIYSTISYLGEDLDDSELYKYLKAYSCKTSQKTFSNFQVYLNELESYLKEKYNKGIERNSQLLKLLNDNKNIVRLVTNHFYNEMPNSMKTGNIENDVIEYLKLIES